jgi:hypothetical protein
VPSISAEAVSSIGTPKQSFMGSGNKSARIIAVTPDIKNQVLSTIAYLSPFA